MRNAIAIFVVLLAACEPAKPPAPPTDVRAVEVKKLPVKTDDAAWDAAPVYAAKLQLQDVVEPRKMKPGATELQVQALTDGRSVAFRLRWKDAAGDSERRPAVFGDACAVQLPSDASPDLPSPMMGEKSREVEITHWSAAAQSAVDGKAVDIKTLYPNAHVDHYPFTAPPLEKDPTAQEGLARAYAPAVAAGNAWPPAKAVVDLVAQGPGTLRPAPASVSEGVGKRTADGWVVVISRPLPKGIAVGSRSAVAFAVWDGSVEDAGSRKMWAPWVPLIVGAKSK